MLYMALAGLSREVVVVDGKLKDFQFGPKIKEEDSWLISELLIVDASQRLTAHGALCHPYFTHASVDRLKHTGALLDPERKVRALRSHLAVVRQRNEPIFSIETLRRFLGFTYCSFFVAHELRVPLLQGVTTHSARQCGRFCVSVAGRIAGLSLLLLRHPPQPPSPYPYPSCLLFFFTMLVL